jgi:ribonuclease inhibitor
MTFREDDSRKIIVVLDVGNIQNTRELHSLLKKELEFPDFYGMNWDAFWDSITGLVDLPESITFEGWYKLKSILPEDSQILVNLLTEFNEKYPLWKCNVIYN